MSLDLLSSRKLSAANTNVTGIRNTVIPILIEYLVVAGGGRGGAKGGDQDQYTNIGAGGGGGGAGGLLTGTNSSITSNVNFTVTVGAAGANSTFSTFTAIAGGIGGTGGTNFGGGGNPGGAGGNGGSGGGGGMGGQSSQGGAGGTGTVGQGTNGTSGSTYGSGGSGSGGGASGTGSGGVISSITGTATTYAAGGVGGSYGGGAVTPSSPIGYGSGGNGANSVYNGTYSNGNPGVVILVFQSSYVPTFSNSNLVYSIDTSSRSGYSIYTFTSGTGTMVFATPRPPAAPASVVATLASQTTVSVAFSAPASNGSAITQYRVTSASNQLTTTGTSSPIIVSGITADVPYTFKVTATNGIGLGTTSSESNSVVYITPNQQEYTTPGTYSWIAPANVTKVQVVAVGGGGAGGTGTSSMVGGGGGGLGWKNNITVTPGQSYTVVVGAGAAVSGYPDTPSPTYGWDAAGGASYFINTSTVAGLGGTSSATSFTGVPTAGGSYVGDGGGSGGEGGMTNQSQSYNGGGGGAGGYAGAGGAAGWISSPSTNPGAAGAGGGGGGGAASFDSRDIYNVGGGGGGVSIYGQGSSGSGGVSGGNRVGAGGSGGDAGVSGKNRLSSSLTHARANGGNYGGGGGSAGERGSNAANSWQAGNGAGGGGAVRIIWGGLSRAFPSTNTGNL